jgi:putative ABC transport system permease protein
VCMGGRTEGTLYLPICVYAARRLGANPGFTAVSVLTLALGIGASTAIFSVINGVLLKPLPYSHSEQLVALLHTAPGIKIDKLSLATSLYFTYSEENRVFQDVGMWTSNAWTVTGLAEPDRVPGLSASNRFLAVLGVQPAFGRTFTAADEDPKSERTVILSDGYWRSRFGGDRSVLGRRILLDGNAHAVIGVLPPSFQFMDRKVSLLVPLRFNRADVRLIGFCCQGIARLKPGVTLAQADADVARMLPMAPAKFALNPGFAQHAFTDARIAPRLRFLNDDLVGDIGDTLWVLMGTVGIVLSIACANVANLLLVRADGRRQELAIRAALGAGFGRIARELLLESVLLGVAGGIVGLAFADAALRVLVASELTHLPRIHEIAIDPTVLAFTAGVSLAAGLLFGLIPIFKYARPQLSAALRSGSRSLTGSKDRHRARSLLVVVQVALALVLLVGSGLMIRTFRALRQVDPGFSAPSELETMRIAIPETQVRDPESAIRMEEAIQRKIEALAGVSRVAMTSLIPLEGGSDNPVYAEDQALAEGGIPPIRRFKFVSPGYISAIGSRLVAGRGLTWNELYNRAPVALVSENMARELWRDPRAAVGKRIRATLRDDWREVIGVVADLHDNGIDQKAPTIVYWPLLQKNFGAGAIRSVAYLIRTPRAGSAGLRQEIQQAVASVNPHLPVADVKTLESAYERSLARTSLTLVLLAIAGSMALLLGVVGIYGVISYSVAQRTREVGIRIALGAPLQEVTRLFVRYGLVMSGIGAICGLTAALALTRLMKSLLFEVSPADPVTYGAASAGLILAALFGSYLPARRAARVDPVEALRAE